MYNIVDLKCNKDKLHLKCIIVFSKIIIDKFILFRERRKSCSSLLRG